MDKIKAITINKDKQNSLAFNVAIEGVDVSEIQVRFLVELDNMSLSFPCEHVSKSEYKVTIPPLKYVKVDQYPCKIEVVAAEYFFSAMDGLVQLTETPKVSAEIVSEQATPAKSISTPPTISVTASEIVVNEEEAPTIPLKSSIIVDEGAEQKSHKGKAVSGILKELGIETPPPIVPKRLSEYMHKGK